MLNNTGNYVKNEKIFKSQLLYKDEYLKCVVCQFFFYTRGLLKAAMFERSTTRNWVSSDYLVIVSQKGLLFWKGSGKKGHLFLRDSCQKGHLLCGRMCPKGHLFWKGRGQRGHLFWKGCGQKGHLFWRD